MVTPLTLYGTHSPATTITTANTLVTSTGAAADLTKTTLVGTASGYGTLRSQGNAGAWPAAGSLPAFNGFGWLWDVTTLEGNTLVGGNFTPSFRLYTSTGTVGGNLYCRVAKVNGGVYTQIGSNFVLSNATITTTPGIFTLPVGSLPTTSFGTGDKLYIQLDLNITSADTSGTATIIVYMANSSTLGQANSVQLITQGYTAGGGGGGGNPPVVGSFGLVANGTGTASFDHFRATMYPDPSLSLANMGRVGSSFFGWNATLPSAATTLQMLVSTDGANFSDMSNQNGGTLPGITSQPDPSVDIFNADTSANYSTLTTAGATAGQWWYDIPNSRLIASGGTGGIYLYGPIKSADIDLLCDMDRSDVGGLAWQIVDGNNFYMLVIADSLATVSGANLATLYKMSGGVQTQLAQATITFVRGTYHRFRVTMLSGVITATMDGAQLFTYTDASPLGAGQVGLYANAGGASSQWILRTFSGALFYGATASTPMVRFYQFWVQPQGTLLAGNPPGDVVSSTFVYTKQVLATTDNTVSPYVQDMTIAVFDPRINPGVILPSADYTYTFIDKNLADLAKQSNYSWTIDENKNLLFRKRTVVPAPWIIYSAASGLVNAVDLEVDTQLVVEVANDQYRNRQVLLNVIATIPFTTTITGNGSASSFPLPYPIKKGTLPIITLNGTPQATALKGTTGAAWYYDVFRLPGGGSSTIGQDPSGTILASTDTMTVSGTGTYITNLVVDNVAAQQALAAIEGGTGIVEAVEDVASRNMDIPSATTYANQLLARYSPTGRTFTFTTYRNGLDVGQQLAVFLPEMGINNGQFLITEVEIGVQTVGPSTVLYKYLVTCTELAYAGSWQKLLASGLLQ